MEKKWILLCVLYDSRQASLTALQVNLLRIEHYCSGLAFVIRFLASSSWKENIEREVSLSIYFPNGYVQLYREFWLNHCCWF